MKIEEIHYNETFEKQFYDLPFYIKKKAIKQEKIFRQNPFHPSLRLHKLKGKLKGLWSISIDHGYRIIFEVMENGDVLFVSIGTHAIYK